MITEHDLVKQEDFAFDLMDAVLDRADWKHGIVTLNYRNNTVYCYDLAALRRELAAIGKTAVTRKFNACQIELTNLVENIVEEYSQELNDFGFNQVQRHTFRRRRMPARQSA